MRLKSFVWRVSAALKFVDPQINRHISQLYVGLKVRQTEKVFQNVLTAIKFESQMD